MHLLFLTARYPYTPGEEFIEEELPVLATAFEHVTIVPVFLPLQEETRPVPGNVSVRADLTREAHRRRAAMHRSITANGRRLRALSSPSLLFESLRCLPFWTPYHLLRFREQAAQLADVVADALPLSSIDVVYSYWLMQGALAATFLKKRAPHLTTIARAHGYDLYPGHMRVWHLPFRSQIVGGLDRVFPCSQAGTRFLRQQVPQWKGRIETRYLGVADQDVSARPSSDGVLRIVSCARVIPLKRLDRIVQALRLVQRRVLWTHIGDGKGLPALRRAAAHLPSHITARFTGHIPHADVLHLLRHEHTDLFCSVSEREGLSVSLLEALSFGIPAIATAVGGHAEVIGTHNGWLLPKHFKAAEAARIIDTFDPRNSERRRVAMQTQRKQFSASANYRAFAEDLRVGFRPQ